MPYLAHVMAGALGCDGEAVKLAGQTDGKVANIDHFLNFAEALAQDLAVLDGDEPAEVVLRGAKLLAEKPDKLAAARRRNFTPFQKGFARALNFLVD